MRPATKSHTLVHEENYSVHGVRKVWRRLCRQRETAGRDQVGRAMKDVGLHGVRRGKTKRTTYPLIGPPAPRHFAAVPGGAGLRLASLSRLVKCSSVSPMCVTRIR